MSQLLVFQIQQLLLRALSTGHCWAWHSGPDPHQPASSSHTDPSSKFTSTVGFSLIASLTPTAAPRHHANLFGYRSTCSHSETAFSIHLLACFLALSLHYNVRWEQESCLPHSPLWPPQPKHKLECRKHSINSYQMNTSVTSETVSNRTSSQWGCWPLRS